MLEFAMFQRLPSWSQAKFVKQKGTRLAQREHQQWTITLYALGSVFVEIWLKDGIEVIGNFKQSAPALDILEPYMSGIEVEELKP